MAVVCWFRKVPKIRGRKLTVVFELNKWLDNRIIKKLVLLFVDGHSTHHAGCRISAENEIILYCLPANATHVLQPADVGLFAPMKKAWKEQVTHWHIDNLGKNLLKKDFPTVFKKTCDIVCTPANGSNAFIKIGLYAINPNAMDYDRLQPSSIATPRASLPLVAPLATVIDLVPSPPSPPWHHRKLQRLPLSLKKHHCQTRHQ